MVHSARFTGYGEGPKRDVRCPKWLRARKGSLPREATSGSRRREIHGVPILLDQPLRPLAPRLPRRPWSAAYGPGPSVFTLRAIYRSTDRASVSQAAARRGAPPLPPMSLGACRRCAPGRGGLSSWVRAAGPTGGGGRAPIRPEENFATASPSPYYDLMVREVFEDGWAAGRQDPLAKAQAAEPWPTQDRCRLSRKGAFSCP